MTERARERSQRGATAGSPAGSDPPVRPPRPVLVEVAAAIMVVTGVQGTLVTIEAIASMAAQGTLVEPIAAISIALGVGSVVLGILVRTGRAWLVAVNLAAITGFLEIMSLSAMGFLFGFMDVAVVLILMRERPWFHWRREAEAAARDGDPGHGGAPPA